MKFQKQTKHMIDIIFPISLFFAFTASAFIAILLAANIYRSTTKQSQEHDAVRISLSYISEKIRQNDVNGTVFLGTLDGIDSLVLKQQIEDTTYITYIYEHNGMLKELFIKEGTVPSPQSGKDIIEVSDFYMEEITENLFQFTAVTEAGYSESITIGIRSKHEEDIP